MPEGVVEKQPDRAAVWTFQEAEAVGARLIASTAGPKICILRSQVHSFSTPHLWLYLPNAEMTLDLEANEVEVEVKVLTSLASVTELTASKLLVTLSPNAHLDIGITSHD